MCLSDIQNRDSFSERIWDDLSEEILQYLSLKNKLRIECVSKQFQRTVFQKYDKLLIDTKCDSRSERICLLKKNNFNLKSLESLLKKCPNITSIGLYGQSMDLFKCDNYNEFIALITKHCNNLVEFNAPLNNLSETVFSEFNKKFGLKLKRLKPISFNDSFKPIGVLHNLEALEFGYVYLDHFNLICDWELPHLKRLNTTIYGTHRNLIMNLLENFKNTQYLCLRLVWRYTQNEMDVILKNISELKDLIELKFDFYMGLSVELFAKSFKQMAKNCLKLKSFGCNPRVSEENLISLLSPLKAFKQLKRLEFKLVYGETVMGVWNPFVHGEHKILFQFDIFEGFPNVTHLNIDLPDIRFGTGIGFDEYSLIFIDKHLPSLQCLEIKGILYETPEGAPQISNILSRLSKLQSLKIFTYRQFFRQRIKKELFFQKCKNIKTIDVKRTKNKRTWTALEQNLEQNLIQLEQMAEQHFAQN